MTTGKGAAQSLYKNQEEEPTQMEMDTLLCPDVMFGAVERVVSVDRLWHLQGFKINTRNVGQVINGYSHSILALLFQHVMLI